MSRDGNDGGHTGPQYKAIDVQQISRITDFINEKAVAENDACVVCGSSQNHVMPHEFIIKVAASQEVIGGGWQMPLYVTMCRDCGFVRLFNGLLIDEAIASTRSSSPSLRDESHGDQ